MRFCAVNEVDFIRFHLIGIRDSDECVTEDTCEQRCRNTIGSFQCSCVEGYELRADRTSCKAINGDPLFPTP
ncbi:Low-density lipoprotein receptor-related protein 4 [Eumeta japonica]|uniref:Low-density lipoprotein receptor-related protein 4 n=1 Tax=Eumeta variegata TaxID=151549 RepID=A0A4C1VDP7_EUMVA|nr:Low-density lipoprotein receptor-related protein 4 [Eumeta japonica]